MPVHGLVIDWFASSALPARRLLRAVNMTPAGLLPGLFAPWTQLVCSARSFAPCLYLVYASSMPHLCLASTQLNHKPSIYGLVFTAFHDASNSIRYQNKSCLNLFYLNFSH